MRQIITEWCLLETIEEQFEKEEEAEKALELGILQLRTHENFKHWTRNELEHRILIHMIIKHG